MTPGQGRPASWLQKAAAIFARVLSLREPQHWRNQDAVSYAGEAVNERSVLALSAVWACVNLLAGTIATLPLMVYRLDRNGNRVVAKDHPLYRILHDSPNADQTAADFWEFGCAAMELRGDLLATIDRLGSRVVGLTPICAPVQITRATDGGLKYRWTEDGRSHDVGADQVFHVRGFGGGPLGGKSTLAYGREAFGLAIATDRAAGSTFANGLRPSGVLTVPTFLKPEQRQPLEDGLQQKFLGAMNAGRPMVLEGGVKWEQLTITPEDAQMLGSRAFSIEEICRFFGVPPFMVGHNEKSSGYPTSLEQQVLTFVKFTLRRRLKRMEMAAEKQLLSAQDRAAGVTVEFNLEGLLRGDSAARSAFYTAGLSNGWMTINEVRAIENLPPVEGGDVPRMQIQNVPITEAGKVAQLTSPTPKPAAPAPTAA